MKRASRILIYISGALLVLYGGLYLSVISSHEPQHHPLARYPLWPVACSTRGCITTHSWSETHMQAIQFALANTQSEPTTEATLTTAIRRHILQHAFLSSPITDADARRYREEILNVAHEEQLRTVVDLTLPQYDRQVLIPYLQQEALRQQHKAESVDDLYAQLSSERLIVVPLIHFRWDTTTGVAQKR